MNALLLMVLQGLHHLKNSSKGFPNFNLSSSIKGFKFLSENEQL